ncbi:MAG: uracil-DNA glycosylase [Gammaproteobacteria bacterium]|nr:uracil-DNA glycosylase [Gammaproteobacteria bacterium]
MDRLQQMGIQRWHLRQVQPTQADPAEHSPDETKADGAAAALDINPEIASEPRSADAELPPAQPNSQSDPPPGTTAQAAAVQEQNPDSVSTASTSASEPNWQALEAMLVTPGHCAACSGVEPILGEGDRDADWLFVIDSPSPQDVQRGQLLSGRGGQLFDALLAAVGLQRDRIYLSSVFKCPPPQSVSVTASCDKLLQQQIALVQPKVVLTFGEFAAQSVIRANEDLQVLRSKPQRCFSNDVAIVPSVGLADVLRSPELKAQLWVDLKTAYRVANG